MVRPLFRGAAALKQRPIEQEEEDADAQLVRAIRHAHGRQALTLVRPENDEADEV